jgi:hypothetical protein
MLNHLSTTIGLDDLRLIDLRHLDPPPALGANLIIIIGTARSIKHLNVAADQFTRHVRRKYKLNPYADGLQGRNELKLKYRRRARKIRLAQSVGKDIGGVAEGDDGILTGWICVNVGDVSSARIPEDELDAASSSASQAQQASVPKTPDEQAQPPDTSYIGFGQRSTSPRIVVQMFTEEKRLEMNLEELWDARTTRRARREEKLMDAKVDTAVVSPPWTPGQEHEIVTQQERQAQAQKQEQEQDAGDEVDGHEQSSPSSEKEDGEGEKSRNGDQDDSVTDTTEMAEEVEEAKEDEEGDESKPLGGMGAS